MSDVAHDADLQAVEVVLVLPDGVQVEQRLRRMLVLAVARVNDACRRMLGNDARCARMLVADDDHVDLVRVERFHRIDEAFALHRARGGAAKIQAVARKALLCQLKRRARARGRLVEHVHDREALERGDLLDLALIDLGQRFGRLENRHDVGIGILIDVDEMLVFESHTTYSPPSGAACARSPGFISRISTADVPSTSSRNRRTFSSRDEGTFLPT